MRFLVTFKVMDTIAADVGSSARPVFRKQIAVWEADERIIEAGTYTDDRGGFFLVDLESPTEFWELIGPTSKYANYDIHTVAPWGELAAMLGGRMEADQAR